MKKYVLTIIMFTLMLYGSVLFFTYSVEAQDVPDAAKVSGKYSELIQILPCPEDKASYGDFNDYGYWGGGAWCGAQGRAGYWVWVNPNWYVWAKSNR
ncbi:secreted protein [Candidatus Magnetoovum chiemensis]|nr:secreted protein [Candidatus Magnetoovum chiemensis]